MDGDERRMVGETITTILRRTSQGDTIRALHDAGFNDLRRDSEPDVLAVLFEAAGLLLSNAPLTNLIYPARPVDPVHLLTMAIAPGAATGSIEGDELIIDGWASVGSVNTAEVPRTAVRLGPATDSVVIVDTELIEIGAIGGLDPTSGISHVHGRVPLDMAARSPECDDGGLRRTILRCLGHQLVGLGQRVYDVACGHVLGRYQFGQQLGVLQTVQHRLADTHVELVAARELLWAAWATDDDASAAMAKSYAATAALHAGAHAQQLTGALGFTWEFGLHRALRRILLLDALEGRTEELNVTVGRALVGDADLRPITVSLD